VDTVTLALFVAALALVLAFSFTNGFNDASAVVATAIASGAVTPARAVALAAAAGGLGVVIGGGAVADTVAKMVKLPADLHGESAVACALAGAVLWNIVTWRLGLPSSSSHALVGGLIGATLVSEGPGAINWGTDWIAEPGIHPIGGLSAVVLALVASPALGFAAALVLHRAARLALRNAHVELNRRLRRMQLATSAVLAFAHGSNDGQKALGVLSFILVGAGLASSGPQSLEARGAVLLAITAGTLGGGWPIMKTLGRRIYAIQPLHALDSQIASAGLILGATAAGAPVSTTHVVASSVMGVGSAEHYKAVRWTVAKHILQAWVTTIPASAVVAAALMALARLLAGW
jgi:PiT family inorganic phosphate transporter